MKAEMKKKAIVVHSGGMDSSICLAIAAREFGAEHVLSLTFSYGQRHASELDAAKKICQEWGIEQRLIALDFLNQLTTNALMNPSLPIEQPEGCAPNTLVLCRNGLLTRIAAIAADQVGAHILYLGVMESSDYRDCSQGYIDLKQQILRLDLGNPSFEIRTPLMHLSKKETLEKAYELGVLSFLLENTVTCYEGIAKKGCEKCPSCLRRNEGLREFASAYPRVSLPY